MVFNSRLNVATSKSTLYFLIESSGSTNGFSSSAENIYAEPSELIIVRIFAHFALIIDITLYIIWHHRIERLYQDNTVQCK